MKRRILLLMMTALLSVGAWAENLWNGSTAIGYYDSNSHVQEVDFPSTVSLQVGDLIVVTANVTGSYWNTVNVCKAKNYWSGDVLLTLASNIASEGGKQFFIPVSTEILSALENGSPQNRLYFDGNDYTLTSVDVTHGNANLFTGTSEQRYGDGYRILPEQFALANTGDVLSISCNYVGDGWGANIWIADNAGETLTTLNPGGSSSMPNTAYLVLTENILTAAKSGGLRLKGGNYDFTSVDIYYSVTSRSVTIGSTGYATFGYPFAVDLSGLGEDQDAYTVTVSGTKALLTSVKGKRIPANTGIILKDTNGNAISLPLTTATTEEIGTNNLHVSDGTVTGDESGTIYVLANVAHGVGFYPVENGSAITAGKAYLKVEDGVAKARQFIGFGDDNETTGIQTVANSQQSAANSYYDLQGRRVAQPTKGLYIVNGKKVIIK